MYESLRKMDCEATFSQSVFSTSKTILRSIPLIVLFLVLGQYSFAQRDQIITQAGEKIRCRILDETPTRFIYAYLGPNNKVLRNEIFKNLVTDFKYNVHASDIVVKGGGKLPDAQMTGKDEPSPRIDTRQPSSSSSKGSSKKQSSRSEKSSAKEEEVAESRSGAKKEEEIAESRSEAKKDDEVASESSTEERSTANKSESRGSSSDNSTKRSSKKESAKSSDKKQAESKSSQSSKKEKEELTEAKKQSKKEDVEKLKDEEPKEDRKATAPMATQPDKNDFHNYLKFRMGIRGGLGNMLNKVVTENATEFDLYREKLQRGYTLGGDLTYFLGEHIGIGATFNNYISNNKAESLKYLDFDGKEATGSISNNISTKFVGPAIAIRKAIDYKTFVILTAGPGVYFYQDKAKLGENPVVKVKGQDFGAAATLGLDFLLGNDITGRDVIISLEAGYNYGKMKSLNYGAGAVTLAKPIDLSRVDFTIGLRFARYPKYLKLTSY